MSEFREGAACLGRGWRLLKRRPRLLLLGMVPALIVWLVLVAAFVLLVMNVGDLASWLTPFADDWSDAVRSAVRGLLAIAIIVGAVLLFSATFTGLTLTVGDPFYERIWRACEEMIGPVKLGDGLGLWRSAVDGLRLAAIGLLCSVGLLLSNFVPIIGPMIGIVLGLLISARFLARELISRPLEARGMDAAMRAAFLKPHRKRLLGFGIVTQLCFLVPLGGVLVMPAAVAGATVLARDILPDERGPAYADEARTY